MSRLVKPYSEFYRLLIVVTLKIVTVLYHPKKLKTRLNNSTETNVRALMDFPPNFIKDFWPLIKDDLLAILNESIKSQEMPRSSRKAVISLLPKKGDLLDIKNWRPVSLLNTDYKICAKVLANRLKNVIGSIVHPDQTYHFPIAQFMTTLISLVTAFYIPTSKIPRWLFWTLIKGKPLTTWITHIFLQL